MSRYGVVIGRFQCNDLTEGHDNLLNQVVHRHEGRVIILVGVRPTRPTDRDPLSFEARAAMIRKWFPTAIVMPLSDCRFEHTWSKQVDNLIRLTTDNRGATIYHGRDGFGDRYTGKYPVVHIHLPDEHINASDIRKHLVENPVNDADFLAGVIHAKGGSNPTWMCVDMALVRPNGDVLMGKKSDDGGMLRFPGGGVDTEDVSLEAAASRETLEETKIGVAPERWNYLGSYRVSDWRLVGTNQTLHTVLYMAELPFAELAIAGDDLDGVVWVPPETKLAQTNQLVPEHWPLWKRLQETISKMEGS